MSTGFAEFAGTTTFGASTYRYTLSLQSDKLRISFEDRDSKQQWCASDLPLTDYVNSSNTIGDATARDYVEVIHRSLQDENATRTFERIKDDVFRLAVSFQLLPHVVARYSFDLEPVTIDRLERLESRVCDLQEELKAMRQTNHVPMILQAEATTMTEGNIICWGKVGDGINVGGEDGVVRNLVPGTYQAMLTVNVEDEMDGLLQLMQNDKCVQSIKSYNSSVSTSCIIRVQEGDKITVTFENSLEATSYLTLVRLGN